jgi:predicted dehydrogenase
MAESKVRIGVIGVGFGVTVHIPAFQSEGLDVVAVCARRRERAADAAQRFGIPNTFTDYREMLKMDGLDAVSIVSPVANHYQMTMDVLNAGKHVICEKPFTLNQADAREAWQKAENSGLTAMIAHEFRFASGRMRVKELIDEGYIGQLHMALLKLVIGPRGGFKPRLLSGGDDASQGGGFLGGLGSHYIDCLRHWFGEIESVSGQLDTHFGDRTLPDSGETVQATSDDAFHIVLRFAGGGWAAMTGTSAAPFGPGGGIKIFGRDGTLITPHTGLGFNPPPHGTIMGAKAGDDALSELPIPDRLEPFADDRDDRMMPFRLLTREFLRGIETGTSPAPNLYDGYRCQQVLDAVRESSKSGRVLRISTDR